MITIDKITVAEKRLSGTCFVCDKPIMGLNSHPARVQLEYGSDELIMCISL